MNDRTGKHAGFVVPAVLACLLIVILAFGILAPLLYRERSRAASRSAAIRDRLNAHRDAIVKLENLSLQPFDSLGPASLSVLEGVSGPEMPHTSEHLLLRRKAAAPLQFPVWTIMEQLFPPGEEYCLSWTGRARRSLAASSFAAEASCQLVREVPLGDTLLKGNLHSAGDLKIELGEAADHVIAAAGEIRIAGEMRVGSAAPARLLIIAIGDIAIERLQGVDGGSLTLSLISLAGEISLKKIPENFGLCENGGTESASTLFLSSPQKISLGGRTVEGPSQIGCPQTLPERIVRPFWPLGSASGIE